MISGLQTRADIIADGLALVFNFTFKVVNPNTLEVFVNGGAPGAYTTALNADQEVNPGGSVTFTVAPADDAVVRIQRTTPLTQETDLQAYSRFPAETVEDTFDRGVMQVQEIVRDLEDLEARVVIVEQTDVVQNGRLDVLEAMDATQNGRLTALEAADVALDARVDAIEAELAALALPWEVMLSFLGPITQDEVLGQYLIADAVALGAGTAAKCRVAPAVGAEIEVFVNGVSVGTLAWAAASTEAVSTVAGNLVPGDLLVLAVASADAAQLDVSITLKGTR